MHVLVSETEQKQLIEKLGVFKIKGHDKRGRKILLIIGKFFPAGLVSIEVLKTYMEEKIYRRLSKKPFCVVYVHTGAQRCENFPGFSALRDVYCSMPVYVKNNMQSLYFVHPGIQSLLFLATLGRFLFDKGLYEKVKYVSRLDLLWEHVRRNEIEIPEFVYDHDEELDNRTVMDYGLESDHPRVYGTDAVVDSSVSMYSMRCIS